MQQQALTLRLDAYHSNVSSGLDAYHNHILLLADGVTFTVSAWDAMAGRGGSDWNFPDICHTFWLLLHLRLVSQITINIELQGLCCGTI